MRTKEELEDFFQYAQRYVNELEKYERVLIHPTRESKLCSKAHNIITKLIRELKEREKQQQT